MGDFRARFQEETSGTYSYGTREALNMLAALVPEHVGQLAGGEIHRVCMPNSTAMSRLIKQELHHVAKVGADGKFVMSMNWAPFTDLATWIGSLDETPSGSHHGANWYSSLNVSNYPNMRLCRTVGKCFRVKPQQNQQYRAGTVAGCSQLVGPSAAYTDAKTLSEEPGGVARPFSDEDGEGLHISCVKYPVCAQFQARSIHNVDGVVEFTDVGDQRSATPCTFLYDPEVFLYNNAYMNGDHNLRYPGVFDASTQDVLINDFIPKCQVVVSGVQNQDGALPAGTPFADVGTFTLVEMIEVTTTNVQTPITSYPVVSRPGRERAAVSAASTAAAAIGGEVSTLVSDHWRGIASGMLGGVANLADAGGLVGLGEVTGPIGTVSRWLRGWVS